LAFGAQCERQCRPAQIETEASPELKAGQKTPTITKHLGYKRSFRLSGNTQKPMTLSITPWPSPLRNVPFRSAFSGRDIPATLAAFIWKISAWDQFWLLLLSIATSLLDTAPIEIQRRLLNATARRSDFTTILVLAAIYVGVVLAEGLVKLIMRMYSGWISESAVRSLRTAISDLVYTQDLPNVGAATRGVQVAMILSESEPVGGFVGDCVSEPLLQGGILVTVFGYMTYLQPTMALVSLVVFSPQFVFVPLIQRAINKRVRERVATLRQTSSAVIHASTEDITEAIAQDVRFGEVFRLNMGIVQLKVSLNFLMNLTHQLGLVTILTVGAWYVLHGKTQIGTIIAFISGLRNINDPWGDLVSWFQNLMVTLTKYDLIVTGVKMMVPASDVRSEATAS
jgi:ABC-type multidrug transport system fused ATPase/permease subunit